MGAIAMVQNGDQVSDALGLSDETYMSSMKYMGLLTLGNLFFNLCSNDDLIQSVMTKLNMARVHLVQQ